MSVKKLIQSVECCLVVAVGVVAVPAGAADVIENFASTNVALAADATYAGTLRADWAADGVDKSGAGTWTLPTDSVDVRVDLPLNLRAGRLALAAGGTPAPRTAPAAVLAKAAFWLDASDDSHLAFDGNSEGVTTWYDVREQQLAGGGWSNGYSRAVSGTTTYSNNTWVAVAYPKRVLAPVGATRPMVYFNGYPNGSWMRFKNNSNGDTNFESFRHVFFVANIQQTWSYLLGSMTSAVYLHPIGTGKISNGSAYYISWNSAPPAMARSSFYLDGIVRDPMFTKVKTGTQLIECKTGILGGGSLSTFANDRNVNNRFGGDYVGELLIFNVDLTDEERLQVEDYLMQKWGIAFADGRIVVKGAAGTEVTAADGQTGRVALTGDEKFVKVGSGTGRFRPQPGEVGAGGIRVEDGTLQTELGELAYAFTPGAVVSAERDAYGVLPVSASTDAARAAAGAASQTGADVTLRVGDQPDSLNRLTLAAKDVVLGARAASAPPRAGAPVSATIANGDGSFENTSFSATKCGTVTSGGWTADTGSSGMVYTLWPRDALGYSNGSPKTGGNSWWFGFNYASSYQNYDYTRWFAPDGSRIVVFKECGALSAPVQVPVAGDYELSYGTAGRIGYSAGTMTVGLVDGAGVTNYIARYIGLGTCRGFRRCRYRIPRLAVGSYTLFVRMDSTGTSDRHVMVDDFRMRLLDSTSEGAVPVPNGDFEDARLLFSDRATLTKMNNNVRGWTLTQGGWGSQITSGVETGAEVAVTSPDMPRAYNEYGVRRGQHALIFQGDEARATTAAFSLPAGHWRLRCKASM